MTMRRSFFTTLSRACLTLGLAAVGLGLTAVLPGGPQARADEGPAPEAEAAPTPVVDTDEVAAAALETFKVEYKAQGLRGDERIAARVFATKRLATVQHADVVARLAKLSKLGGKGNQDVRTAAIQYLGLQSALPGLAGKHIEAAIKKNRNDEVIVVAGLQAFQALPYHCASELVGDLMKHPSYSVKKASLATIAALVDMRHVEMIFRMLKEIKKKSGDSWDGVSVSVDTGASGTTDQDAAEAQGREQMAKNKRKGGRGGGGRSQRDMGPIVEEVLKKLTGMEFESAAEARTWFEANAKAIKDAVAALDVIAEAQAAAAK